MGTFHAPLRYDPFPEEHDVGAIEDNSLITEYGKEVARQCKEMGIHINFAPDMDVNSNTDNPVIGLRSFGENPEAVADKGLAYARGLEGQGILSVAKHFSTWRYRRRFPLYAACRSS